MARRILSWNNLVSAGAAVLLLSNCLVLAAQQPDQSVGTAFAASEQPQRESLQSTASPAVNCGALLSLPICRLQPEIDAVGRINKHRVDSGRAPLIWDYRLFQGARCHSTDMIINNCFQIDDCDGTSWFVKYTVVGYTSVRGQDMAANFTSGAALADALLAAGGLHAQLLLDPLTKHVAVGYATNGFNTSYWTVAYGGATTAQALPCGCCINQTGNVDCDPLDGADISDLSALIDYLYISFSPLCCPEEANTDGQPGIDIADLSALIDYLYISFALPANCQ